METLASHHGITADSEGPFNEITPQTIITAGAVLAALLAIIGYYNKGYKRYLKILAQEEDVKQIKKEQTLIIYALSACLDGLEQLGANHTVPLAKEKLNRYINQLAHDQLDN